jgi:heat shock protein HslJ
MSKSEKIRLHFFALAGLAALASTVLLPPVYAQTAKASTEVLLPRPSSMGQPAPTPLDRTTWKVISVTERGKTTKPKNPYGLLFDFSDHIGIRNVLSFDGCEPRNGSFELKSNLLIVGNRYESGRGCPINSISGVMDKVLSGKSTITPAKSAIWFRGITLTNGSRSARLEPLVRSDLVGTAWVLETVLEPKPISLPSISFDGTRISGGDGCNSFDGAYLAVGDQLVAGEMSQTAMACPGHDGWAVNPTLEGTPRFLIDPTGKTLTLTKKNGALKYRRAQAVVRPSIPGL